MFRRRNVDHVGDLPTTSSGGVGGGSKRPSAFSFTLGSSAAGDGSARSIRLKRKSLLELWRAASTPVKVSYICLFSFLFSLYYGIRLIRYTNSHVHVDCQSMDCRISILPVGWHKRVVVDFPRKQLLQAFSVRVDDDGNFLSANPPLDDFTPRGERDKYKGNKYAGKSSMHYRGPDADGNYVSYALILRDKPVMVNPPGSNGTNIGRDRKLDEEYIDLSSLDPYTVIMPHGTRRLIMRQFKIAQSKQRVRTMITRIDSYIKRRRQRLIVKENGIPSWQGILLIVLGIIGFLLTVLVGQFWDEPPVVSTGPGVRRQQHHHDSSGKKKTEQEIRDAALLRATPGRYEVRTQPIMKNRFS